MSVQELRARIAKFSTEIDLQKEVLKKLEREKSLVQRQLNAVLDPVARLPFEISTEIFLQTFHPYIQQPCAMLLLNICHSWTVIALSTPDLWSTIEIKFPCGSGLKKFLPIWLRRAGNRPLSISLSGKFDDQGVAACIWSHGQQLKRLEICEEEGDGVGSDEGQLDTEIINLFGGMHSPGPLPLLETLVVRGEPDSNMREYSGPQLLELLRQAPNLVECIFRRVQPVDGLEPLTGPDEVLVLPTLRRLYLGERFIDTDADCDSGVLEHLSLPMLETLSLSLTISSGRDFLSFLKRSSPPLQELTIGLSSLRSVLLHECFRLVPTLARFKLWIDTRGHHLAIELFNALADSPSLLPNLHSLVLQGFPLIQDSSWTTVLRALSARRTQIRVVQLVSYRLEANSTMSASWPPTDILVAFRELVKAHGMQISLGAVKIL
jgi:hypothetical protein